MEQDDGKILAQWVSTWERAGQALEAVRRAELSSCDFEIGSGTIDDMLDWACDHAEPRESTGLLDMQRWFRMLRTG